MRDHAGSGASALHVAAPSRRAPRHGGDHPGRDPALRTVAETAAQSAFAGLPFATPVPPVSRPRRRLRQRRRPAATRAGGGCAARQRGAVLDAPDAAEFQVVEDVGSDDLEAGLVMVARPAPLWPEVARLAERHLYGEQRVLPGDCVVLVLRLLRPLRWFGLVECRGEDATRKGHGEWRKRPFFDRFVQFDPNQFRIRNVAVRRRGWRRGSACTMWRTVGAACVKVRQDCRRG